MEQSYLTDIPLQETIPATSLSVISTAHALSNRVGDMPGTNLVIHVEHRQFRTLYCLQEISNDWQNIRWQIEKDRVHGAIQQLKRLPA